jgi:hypothetical protein
LPSAIGNARLHARAAGRLRIPPPSTLGLHSERYQLGADQGQNCCGSKWGKS